MITVMDDLKNYKAQLNTLHHTLAQRVFTEPSALGLLNTYTHTVDTLLINIWQKCQVDSSQYCLLAVGGYGRFELYPYSDVDILILTQTSIHNDKSLEYFLQNLWDLKLKISPVTVTQEQLRQLCAENLHTLTSILDQRYLCGSQHLYHLFCQYSAKLLHLSAMDFYQQKKQEQQQRHQRFGTSALSLEPNIKESPGGLRDIQTLLWCIKYTAAKVEGNFRPVEKNTLLAEFDRLSSLGILTQKECQTLSHAYFYLARTRFALHLQAQKNEDRLSFELQPLLAIHCHQTEKNAQRIFMKVYYDNILMLMRYAQLLEKSFLLWRNKDEAKEIKIDCMEKQVLEMVINCHTDIPLSFLRKLYFCDLNVATALTIEVQRLFLKVFDTAPGVYPRLKALHIWGILPYYLPELQFGIGLIQHSLFHSYTVDEHTLLLTMMIDKFYQAEYQSQYPLCQDIIFSIQSPQVLYLAALLHDSGKGHAEDHSLVGKQLAMAASLRLTDLLNEEEKNNLIWLVENHLLMSNVAQKQDIHDPQVVIVFAKKVKNINRLKLLYLLTVADISATNPTLWNGWKGSLLKKLYLATEKALQRDYVLSPIDTKTMRKKEKTVLLLLKQVNAPIDPALAQALWQNWPAVYFLHHSVPSIAKHTALVLRQKSGEAIFGFSDHPKQGHYELFIYCQDRPFLFSLFTNVLEKENLNIVSADILTTANGYALDSFYLLRNQSYAQSKLRLLQRLKSALHHLEKYPHPPLFSQRFHKKISFPAMLTEIKCHQKENQNSSELEIISYDRPGLLAKIGLVFAEHELNLEQAKIATLGQRVEDVFILSNKHKQRLSDGEIKALTQNLLEALNRC